MNKNNESFVDLTEEFLKEIVREVRTDSQVDIKTKVEVLREMTRWVSIKGVEPTGPQEGSKIDEYRAKLSGAAGGKGDTRRTAKRGAAASGSETKSEETKEDQ